MCALVGIDFKTTATIKLADQRYLFKHCLSIVPHDSQHFLDDCVGGDPLPAQQNN
jgi:hypothetical protein